MNELREFCAWYWKHSWFSGKKGLSLYKAILGFVLSAFSAAIFLFPSWEDSINENSKHLQTLTKLAALIVLLLFFVFGPLWYAFKEVKEKDAKLKELAEPDPVQEFVAIRQNLQRLNSQCHYPEVATQHHSKFLNLLDEMFKYACTNKEYDAGTIAELKREFNENPLKSGANFSHVMHAYLGRLDNILGKWSNNKK